MPRRVRYSAAQCQALTYQNLQLTPLIEGDTLQLSAGTTSISSDPLSAEAGALVPSNPY